MPMATVKPGKGKPAAPRIARAEFDFDGMDPQAQADAAMAVQRLKSKANAAKSAAFELGAYFMRPGYLVKSDEAMALVRELEVQTRELRESISSTYRIEAVGC